MAMLIRERERESMVRVRDIQICLPYTAQIHTHSTTLIKEMCSNSRQNTTFCQDMVHGPGFIDGFKVQIALQKILTIQ